MKEIYKYGRAVKSFLTPKDIIMILGGGNMGDMYLKEEEQRRFIIKNFKNNRIISLPQTISFSDTENGKKEFEKTKKIYNSHKNLLLVAREDKSFEIMKERFSEFNVIEVPDMVLYLNKKENEKRDGIMFCLRKDKEGLLSEEFKKNISKVLMEKYQVIKIIDTVLSRGLDKNTRDKEFEKLITEIKKSRLVITDRLHGMIFCAITGTPCIVLKTFNHKVTESYKWLEKLGYIKMVTGEELEGNLVNICNEMMDVYINSYSFSKEFSNLETQILKSN
jgi:pyruvyl transferase EpsI